jgi:hypothetical protein
MIIWGPEPKSLGAHNHNQNIGNPHINIFQKQKKIIF